LYFCLYYKNQPLSIKKLNRMKYIFAIGFLCFAICLQGQTIDLNQGNFIANDYFIELPYQNINDKIIIEIELGGKKRKFIVDTGAPLVLSKALFEALNCPVLSKQPVSDINQKKDSLLFVRVDSLKIGSNYLTGIPAVVLNNNVIMDCLGIDGFIGSNVLRNSIIQFDAKNETIRITNDLSKLNVGGSNGADLMLDQQSSPYLKFNIGKKISEFALFDSGSDEFYSMAHGKIKKFIKAKDLKIMAKSNGSNTMGMTGVGNYEETALLYMPFVKLNGVQIDHIVSESNNDLNSSIGVEILQYGKLTIDYKNKKCYFENYETTNEFKNDQLQISPNYINNSLCIGKIWNKELAGKVTIGDKIVSINGVNVENMTMCEALTKPSLKGNANTKLDVKKSTGEIISIVIDKVTWEKE